MASSSGSSRAYVPDSVNMTKAKVKKKKNSDWSWEDEMLMYDVVHRDTAKRKRTDAKEERRQLIKEGVIDPELEAEVKKLKREQEQDLLYQREERKLFLGKINTFRH